MTFEKAIQEVPYARQLGFEIVEHTEQGAIFELQPDERFIGNPMLRAFHGGVICGLMECAMSLTVMGAANLAEPPRLINQTTSFLGSASADEPVRIRTEMTKPGKRILGAYARAYQRSEEVLVAKCSSLFKVRA